jgi:hypothetical protein
MKLWNTNLSRFGSFEVFMKKFAFANRAGGVAFLGLLLGGSAWPATILIDVRATLAPNIFGSPSYLGGPNSWVDNAFAALQGGLTSYGDPTLPTYYQDSTLANASTTLVTSFPSWLGVADPIGAFAAEYGNRISYPVHIYDSGAGAPMFSLAQLTFAMDSSEPGDALQFSGGFTSVTYSARRIGVIHNLDGSTTYLQNGEDSNTLVNEIYYAGIGNSLVGDCPGCTTTAERQAAIDTAASYFPYQQITQVTNIYTITQGATTYSGSATLDVFGDTPEPGTAALLFGGVVVLLAGTRRPTRR